LTGYYKCCKRNLIYLDVVQRASIVVGKVVNQRNTFAVNLYKHCWAAYHKDNGLQVRPEDDVVDGGRRRPYIPLYCRY